MTYCWSQRAAVARRLEDQTLAVVAEIRLGVLTAEGELADVARGARSAPGAGTCARVARTGERAQARAKTTAAADRAIAAVGQA